MRRRLSLILLLCLFTGMATPAAAGPSAKGAFAWLWSWVARLDNGCQIDPNGAGCRSLELDLGCQIDPNGAGCRSLELDLGCKIDPDGAGCRSLELDNGCQIDPHGQPSEGCAQLR